MAPKREAVDVARLAARLMSMKQARKEFEPELTDICRYIAPRKADIKTYTGKPDDTRIWNSVPTQAAEMLAASLGGLITNPSTTWMNLFVRYLDLDELSEGREWLEECRDRMLALFNSDSGGFQQAVGEMYLDVASMGTGVMFVALDGLDINTGEQNNTSDYGEGKPSWSAPKKPKRNGGRTIKFPAPAVDNRFIFRTIPLWEVYLGGDKNGNPAHVYRVFKMTLQQAWDTWGKQCSRKVTENYQKNPEDTIEVCHAVYPRENVSKRAVKAAVNLPFASVYFEHEGNHLLEESGFHEMPYLVWRWSVVSGKMYGRGPAHTALPFVRVLNAVAESELLAVEKQADPPLMVPDDSFLGPVRSGPGGLSHYRPGSTDKIEQLPIQSNLSHVDALLVRLQNAIQSIFYLDKLEFQADPNETATVAMARQNEKMRLLGPVTGRCQSEFLGNLISRVFNIMLRNGEFPQMPAQLADALMDTGQGKRRIRVEYGSPMAIEQRSVEVQAFQRTTGVLAPLIGEQDPFNIMDNFDTDDIVRWVHNKLGGSAGNLRPVEDVKALRKQRADAQKKAQDGQDVVDAANIAETLSKTQLGPNNALGALGGAAIPGGGLA